MRIRADLDGATSASSDRFLERDVASDCELTTFSSVSSDEIMKITRSFSYKSCEPDSIPGLILRACAASVLPIIT